MRVPIDTGEIQARLHTATVDAQTRFVGTSIVGLECSPELVKRLETHPDQFDRNVFLGATTMVGSEVALFDCTVVDADIRGTGTIRGASEVSGYIQLVETVQTKSIDEEETCFTFNAENKLVGVNGSPIKLTGTEQVLFNLLKNQTSGVLSYERIRMTTGYERCPTLRQHIHNLRSKLHEAGFEGEIKTWYGEGIYIA